MPRMKAPSTLSDAGCCTPSNRVDGPPVRHPGAARRDTLAGRTRDLTRCTSTCTLLDVAKTYTIAGARANLSEIVDEVEGGSEVELTRRGKRVAIVMSAARYARLRGERLAFMAAYETFRSGHDLAEAGLDRNFARALRQEDVARPVKL